MKNVTNINKYSATLSLHGLRKRQSDQLVKKSDKNHHLINNVQRIIYVQKPKLMSKINRQLKILLVEDNLIAQTINKCALEQAGYEVEVADTGEQALDKSQHTNYSLIFMDIDLPGISGIEAAVKIRGSKLYTPIVALTTNPSDEIKEQCLAVGMSAFANKPISGAGLSKLAKQYCAI